MGVHLCNEFLVDIRDHGDRGFARRVLSKVLGRDGSFRLDRDDHRFHGIEDAWIRVVSRGNTAYRVIYIRRGPDVYLYRAGDHSIEERASANVGDDSAQIVSSPVVRAAAQRGDITGRWSSKFLRNSKPKYIREALLGRRLLPHSEVFLISPFLSFKLFELSSTFGKMITDIVEDGAEVNLFTLPPHSEDPDAMDRYGALELQGINVFFQESLHAKLYTFKLDRSRLRRGDAEATDYAILGSANLTEAGTNLEGTDRFNEEFCYELPPDVFGEAVDFGIYLSTISVDFVSFRVRNRHGKAQPNRRR